MSVHVRTSHRWSARSSPASYPNCLSRVTGAADRRDVADDLIEFESKANFIHARHDHVVICSYDATKFDGAFIIAILRTHPIVLIGGVLQENPFFLPPFELLEERAARADR